MDAFRAKTTLWSVASGYVDADWNFRPIQTNPSCIEICDDEYCPADEDIVYPVWHYEETLEDGPSKWYQINSLCTHEQQSPIRIHPDKFEGDDACSVPLDWHVDGTVYDWTVTHKGEGGHTMSVYSADAKSGTRSGPMAHSTKSTSSTRCTSIGAPATRTAPSTCSRAEPRRSRYISCITAAITSRLEALSRRGTLCRRRRDKTCTRSARFSVRGGGR